MKKICRYIIILFSISLNAQDFTYTIKKENTNIKFIASKFSFWDIMISDSRMTFAGGFGAKMYLNGLYVNLNYDYHYVDDLAEAISAENVKGSSIYRPTNSRNGEATFAYFIQKEKEGTVTMSIKHSRRYQGLAEIKAKYNKIFGVQFGYKSGFSHLVVPESVVVKDYYSGATFTTDGEVTTFMNYGWILVGPSFGSILDIEVDFDGFGIRKRRSFHKTYANFIVAASSSLEDVYYIKDPGTSKKLVNQYVLQGNVVMSKIGFNIGYEEHTFSGVGPIIVIEGGVLPGVKNGGNIYLAIKCGLILGKAFGG